MKRRKERRSRISRASHEHRSGDRKTDLRLMPGVNAVRHPRTGRVEKLATTPLGRERLLRELAQ